jgi:2-hydroxycyclohexanecarboxyl-CoA dehydrogenase
MVTGGAGGIGRAIAAALAADGRAVAVADLSSAEAEKVASELDGPVPVLGVELDVTDNGSVKTAIEQTEVQLGPLDVVVNNAGWDELRPFMETDEQFWDRVIEINFKGCLRVTHAALPGMIERRWGRLVNIGSDAGRVGSSGESVYSGTKGALIAFTKTIAREVARHHINVNCICPGPSDTPLFQKEFIAASPKLAESLRRLIPWGRLGVPDDVAPAVVFLASDDAGFITGQTLSVSGGLTMV